MMVRFHPIGNDRRPMVGQQPLKDDPVKFNYEVDMNQSESHQQTRMKVWTDAWCATANAVDCKSHSVAIVWADKALAAFDERFPAEAVNLKK